MDKKEIIIRKEYYSPSTGFVGIDKLYHKLKKFNISRDDIIKFIKKQEVFQRNKKINYKRNSFIPLYPLQEFQIDLIYIDNPTLNNARYGLCAIDSFTKKADVVLLKKKTTLDVINGMKIILKTLGKPDFVYCDEGSEFTSNQFKELMKENNIKLIFAFNHAVIVERFNRTIKEMISKYLQSTHSKTIINVLPKIVDNYNNSYHTSIGMAPNEVNESNMHRVQIRLIKRSIIRRNEKLKIGDKVRVQLKENTLKKGYRPKFSEKIHTIVDKKNHYYIVDGSKKMFQIGNLLKVNEVEENPNEPELDNTLEKRSKELHKHKVDKKYNIPELNINERKLRQRNPTSQLEHKKYGNIIF